MSKVYVVQFGTGYAASFTGLSPTFLNFAVVPLDTTTAPTISEFPVGSGLYYFIAQPPVGPTQAINFTIDGFTIGLGLSRYVSGAIDPDSGVGTSVAAIGVTLANLSAGNSFGLIGTLADSFGSTLSDPSTVIGYLKRIQENLEGNSLFSKTSGQWQIWSRGSTYILGASTYPGSSTMIQTKTLLDAGSQVTKS